MTTGTGRGRAHLLRPQTVSRQGKEGTVPVQGRVMVMMTGGEGEEEAAAMIVMVVGGRGGGGVEAAPLPQSVSACLAESRASTPATTRSQATPHADSMSSTAYAAVATTWLSSMSSRASVMGRWYS